MRSRLPKSRTGPNGEPRCNFVFRIFFQPGIATSLIDILLLLFTIPQLHLHIATGYPTYPFSTHARAVFVFESPPSDDFIIIPIYIYNPCFFIWIIARPNTDRTRYTVHHRPTHTERLLLSSLSLRYRQAIVRNRGCRAKSNAQFTGNYTSRPHTASHRYVTIPYDSSRARYDARLFTEFIIFPLAEYPFCVLIFFHLHRFIFVGVPKYSTILVSCVQRAPNKTLQLCTISVAWDAMSRKAFSGRRPRRRSADYTKCPTI